MKKTLIFSLLLFSAACSPVSVIPDGEGPGDQNIPSPPGEEQTVSIAFLKTLYNGAPVRIKGEYRISGAVVSDDRQGNFYKTLVIDDGTGGIELKLDMEQIFKRFMIHTRVAVRCNGLWLGSYGGTLQLGAEPFDDYQTQYISEVDIAEHIFSDNEFYGEVKARELSFSELAARHISTYVAFDGVRFIEEEQGLSWAETEVAPNGNAGGGNGVDKGDDEAPEVPSATNRHLVDAAGDTLIVRTGRYANFARWTLPAGTGRIEGVLGYFNGDYQIIVCDSEKFTTTRN